MWAKSVCVMLFIAFFVSSTVGRHTLHVDEVYPSATNTVTINELVADVMEVNQADLQFINLNLKGPRSLEINPVGPVSLDGSYVGFDSATAVNLNNDGDAQFSTPDTLSLSGTTLGYNVNNFALQSGGDLFLNTDGSIRARTETTNIRSLADLDIESAVGPIEMLAAGILDVSARRLELLGDDRVSLYSFHNFQSDTAHDFEAFSAFIDFDSFGDIRLASTTGSVNLDTVRTVMFEADTVSMSAPIGIDFQSEHGEVNVNVKDRITGRSDDLIYLETVDEARFLASRDFSLSASDLVMATRRSVNFRADTAEVIFTEADISSQETEISTGGDINFLLNANNLAVYKLEADDRMSFDSRTIKASTTTTTFSAGGNGDIEIAADREFDSRVVAQAKGDLSVQAKNSANARAARLSLDAASAAFSASGDMDLLADSSFEDGFRATSDGTIGLQFNQLVGNGERGLWKASGALNWNAGSNLTVIAGREVDEDFAIESREGAVRIAGNQRYIQRARLGSQTFETEDMSIITNSEDITIEARRSADLSARGDVEMNAAGRVRWIVDESAFEAESISFTANNADMSISGSVIDLWATEEGSFTAGQQILFNADGDVNLSAFTDIVIDNLGTVNARAIVVDAGERFDLSSGGGVDVINAGTTNIITGSGFDFSFNGNSFGLNATNSTFFNGGFIRLEAAKDVLLEADKISIATRDEENVRFYSADDIFWSMKSGAQFAYSDDDLISRSATNLLRANGTNGSLEFEFQRDWEAYIRSHAQVNLTGLAAFTATQGNILLEAKGDITTTLKDSLAFASTLKNRVDVQGDLNMTAGGTINMTGGAFQLTQQPGPASLDDVTIKVGDDQVINLSGSFTQTGGSNAFTSTSWTQIAERVLIASQLSTYYNLTGAMTLEAVNDGGRIRLDASDFDGNASGDINVKGGQVNFSSRRNDYIDFVSTGGDLSVTSQANSPITWNAGETFNLTALAGLVVTSKTSKDGTGILFESMNTLANNIVFNTRSSTDGRMDVLSLDTQTFQGDTIELLAGRDFTYTNFFRPKEVGGVRVVSNGYGDDGSYQDRTGIVVRSYAPGGFIRFDSEKGTASLTAGRSINTRVEDAAAFYTSDEYQSFLAERGNITLTSEQGDVIMRADTNNVTFTTNSDASITASRQVNVYASNAITLESTDPITNGDNELSFEFSATDGNIFTRSFASNPIIFEGDNFELVSNEDTRISAATDIPFTSNTAGFNLTALSGIFFEVAAGDFELTASDNIRVSSGKNEDISFKSGDNLQVSTDEGQITFRAGKDTIFRTQRDDLLIQTRDSNGDINFQGGGDIRFQADGTDDNVGASQVDGIFINAPRIQTFATDDAIFDNEFNFVVGANTRPIITLIAGGNIFNPGVTYSAEANILQEIGENFVINSAGTIYMETQQEFDFQAGGEINIISKGTNALGKDVRFETNQKSDVRAGNVEINGGKRVAFVGDNLVQLESKSTVIDLNVLNRLRTNINETYDINADTWAWTSRGDYYMRTRGDVRFTNGPQGTISIEADTDGLNFLSDTNARFQTTGANAPLLLQTFGTNSNLFASTAALSSNIDFRTGKAFTATAEDGGRITSTETTQITAPADRLDTIGKSNITLTSAADTIINAQRNIDVAGGFGLSLAATLPAGADLNVASNGNILVQSWQDASFRSVTDDVSFNADFNVTYITRQGDLRLVSTRDIDVTADGNVISRYEGDYLVTNNNTYAVSAVNSAFFTTTGQDSDIVFTSRGPVNLAAQDDIVWAGGATTFRAGGEADVVLDNGLSITTFGEQTDIQFRSEQGLLTFFTPQNIDFIMSLTDGPFRSGTNYIDFTARGTSPAGYSIRMEAASFTTSSRAANAFYADEKLTIAIDDTINIRAKNLQDDNPNLVFSATNDGGNINTLTNLYQINADNAYLEAEDNILLLPFDTIRFTTQGAPQQSLAENDYMGLRIESHHPSADVRLVTTDFLTGDINFAATGAGTFNTYSYAQTTLFLLDDDDTNFVGTFLVQSGAGSDINVAAENNIVIRESSTGDITFEDSGRSTFFTAGNDFNVAVRNRFFIDAPTVVASADRGMDIVADQDTVTMNAAGAFYYRAESYFQMVANNNLNVGLGSPSVRFIGGARVAFEDTDVGSDLLIVANGDITINASTNNGATIQAPPQGIVDFRDGLVIPMFDLPNNACGGQDRNLVFDSARNNICFCDINVYRCLPTILYTPA